MISNLRTGQREVSKRTFTIKNSCFSSLTTSPPIGPSPFALLVIICLTLPYLHRSYEAVDEGTMMENSKMCSPFARTTSVSKRVISLSRLIELSYGRGSGQPISCRPLRSVSAEGNLVQRRNLLQSDRQSLERAHLRQPQRDRSRHHRILGRDSLGRRMEVQQLLRQMDLYHSHHQHHVPHPAAPPSSQLYRPYTFHAPCSARLTSSVACASPILPNIGLELRFLDRLGLTRPG